jgi:hypothetical protein
MVPSSVLAITVDGERLSCSGFSLGETICFGSLEFIISRFGFLSLSPLGYGLGVAVMGPTHSGTPLPQQTMAGDSAEGFPIAHGEKGWTDLPSPRRHDAEAPPASTMTALRPENPWTNQATTTIPSR